MHRFEVLFFPKGGRVVNHNAIMKRKMDLLALAAQAYNTDNN